MRHNLNMLIAVLCLTAMPWSHASVAAEEGLVGPGKPVLAVRPIEPRQERWSSAVAASGWIAAWDEASISTEIGGLTVEAILVDVGDTVKKGQILARLSDHAVAADLRRQQAVVASAEANFEKATAEADRARRLSSRAEGTMSQKDILDALIGEKVAKADLDGERASLESTQIRLEQTIIRAIDDGVVSQKSATLGEVPAAGSELFRLVRQHRIEWQAEVATEDLPQVAVGQKAKTDATERHACSGTVRAKAPTANRATGRAIVYVDLPADCDLAPGAFAGGTIEAEPRMVLTVPSTAVAMEGATSYVFSLTDAGTVARQQVATGRRRDGRVEILSGLDEHVRLVESGGGFLFDGASVRVVGEAEDKR